MSMELPSRTARVMDTWSSSRLRMGDLHRLGGSVWMMIAHAHFCPLRPARRQERQDRRLGVCNRFGQEVGPHGFAKQGLERRNVRIPFDEGRARPDPLQ